MFWGVSTDRTTVTFRATHVQYSSTIPGFPRDELKWKKKKKNSILLTPNNIIFIFISLSFFYLNLLFLIFFTNTPCASGFGAQLIGPIQLHVKRQNSRSANFSRTLLGPFSVCEWQDLSFTCQKSEKTTYLDNLVFSAFSVLWGTVKKSGLKSDPRQTLPGQCARESVTK